MFALKLRVREEVRELPKEDVRPPRESKNRDLEAALENVIERFPRALDYLAK